VFQKYPNKYFIGAGTNMSIEIQQALEAGFSKILGLESDHNLYTITKKKFKGNDSIKIYRGDSSKYLCDVIKDVNSPITFWLDGEYKLIGKFKGTKYYSLMEELDQIASHPIKTHTILIDDVRSIGSREFDVVALNEVILKILKINPDYCIDFEYGDYENDILVAYIDDEL